MSCISSSSLTAINSNTPIQFTDTDETIVNGGGTPPGKQFVVARSSNVQIQFAGYIIMNTEDAFEVVNISLRIVTSSGNEESAVQTVRAESQKAVTVTPLQLTNLEAGTYYAQIVVSKNSSGTDTAIIKGELSIFVTSSGL
jgi:hypothetical protein